MKKFISFFTFTYLLGLQILPAQTVQDIEIDVVYLSSNYVEGRETGTKGEERAAAYIAKRFEALGLYPIGDNKTYYQQFPFQEVVNPHVTDGTGTKDGWGQNVLAYLDKGAETTVVIGAHYDHTGYGSTAAMHTGASPTIQNGADKNASGVGAMLYLAEALLARESKNNYLFIAFSGKEKGLAGSKYYVDNPMLSLDRVNYMLNLDQVGRLDEKNTIILNGVGTATAWKQVVWKIRDKNITTNLTDSGIGVSDHNSFYLIDIPVVHVTTSPADAELPETDTAQAINMEGIQTVSDYLLRFLTALDTKGKLNFIETENHKASRRVSKYKVTLGVMPDYLFAGSGMKIKGILADRPAEKAGLEAGDIVLQVGEYPIKDIYAYMEVLGKLEPASKQIIVIQRGAEALEKEVQF